jgi:hypothetical protein
MHAIFEAKYKAYLDKYSYKRDAAGLAREVRRLYENRGRGNIPKHTVQLLAGVFATWSLTTVEDLADGTLVMKNPLCLQELAIFCLLGLEKEPSLMKKGKSVYNNAIKLNKSHLIQILTGQGKSITLGILSTTLAILDYDVSCVCYSSYLSKRDWDAFEKVFEHFDVMGAVNYGTFQALCERQLNKDGNVRADVRSLLEGTAFGAPAGGNGRKHILLIDEVDVFFSQDFYGNTYSPSATITREQIEVLQRNAWQNRKDSNLQAKLMAMPAYKALLALGKDSAPIYAAHIAAMVQDLKRFLKDPQAEPYTVTKEGRIAYKTNMTFSTKIVHGYRTLWAHFHEHGLLAAASSDQDASDAREVVLKESMGFNVNCGAFSYAEIPKHFHVILGVTGTLETLPAPLKKTIRDVYKITGETLMPSIFGSPKLESGWETKAVKVHETQAEYYVALDAEIKEALGLNQPALLFFETETKMKEFGNSGYCSIPKERWISSDTPRLDWYVASATRPGQVTMFARDHGRGIDFACNDDRVNASGGVRVIQAFFSDELSEETQIKGRTARQDRKGMYSLVLLETDVTQSFDATSVELADWRKHDTMYDGLSTKRDALCLQAAATRDDVVKCALAKHAAYLGFQRSLNALRGRGGGRGTKGGGAKRGGDDANLLKSTCLTFLREKNVAKTTGGVKVLIAIDGTYSMSNVLNQTKARVSDMIDRTKTILEDNGFLNGYQMQIAIYRQYNVDAARLLQASTWESSSDRLEDFMRGAPVAGGWGEEAVEVALAHANREHMKSTDLVIVIGDIGPNSRADVDYKRKESKAAQDWSTHPHFRDPCYWDDELETLIANGVTVCGFLVGRSYSTCPAEFVTMAQRSGGEHGIIDVNDSGAGGDILTNTVSKRILDKIGGAELVSAYEKEHEGASYRE